MPWVYGPKGVALMRKYFTLRMRLMPYLYTYTWQAHRRSLPHPASALSRVAGPRSGLPALPRVFFGAQMLVAPVLEADGQRSVYLPPGSWMDFFTGRRYQGRHARSPPITLWTRHRSSCARVRSFRSRKRQTRMCLTVNVYGDGNGRFDLYEDDGASLDYEHGAYALTPMTYRTSGASHRLVIGPTTGSLHGQQQARAYALRIHTATPAGVNHGGRRTPARVALGCARLDRIRSTARREHPARGHRRVVDAYRALRRGLRGPPRSRFDPCARGRGLGWKKLGLAELEGRPPAPLYARSSGLAGWKLRQAGARLAWSATYGPRLTRR